MLGVSVFAGGRGCTGMGTLQFVAGIFSLRLCLICDQAKGQAKGAGMINGLKFRSD